MHKNIEHIKISNKLFYFNENNVSPFEIELDFGNNLEEVLNNNENNNQKENLLFKIIN